MLKQSTQDGSCTLKKSDASPAKRLAAIASSSHLAHLLATVAASALVIASAGFGAVYAWTTGSAHGIVLGGLFVLMAVALEIAKPLAVASIFTSFRKWAVVRGCALALLATVAIAYSLTAELTLMAGARGDVVARREAMMKATASTDDEAKRAKDRYAAAKVELATLRATRPVGEVSADIAAIDQLPGIVIDGKPCGGTLNGKVTKEWCPKRSVLAAEKARAERRAELVAVMALPFPVATANTSEPQVKDADPGASALSTYLAALGFVLPATLLTDWLALIPVLALELGSALAGLLVQSVSQPSPSMRGQIRCPQDVNRPIEEPASSSVGRVGHSNETGGSDDVALEAERVKRAILGQLKDRGEVEASQRGLAALIGTSRPTVRRAINALMVAGLVAAEATRNGTVLRLVT